MAEKTLAEIPRNLRELYDKGNAALQKKNYDYAIAIYNQVLQGEPAFYPCREALRASQFAKAEGGGFFKKVFGRATSSPLFAKVQIQLRTNPRDALATCEQILNGDPSNGPANKMLAEAAMSLDLPKTAVLSLEICYKNSPDDLEAGMRLGEALTAAGQIDRAEKIYSDLKRAHAGDPTIDQALKNVAAKRTLREGGYDELASGTGSYRDILKDKGEAAALEQESRTVKSEDVALNLIQDYTARLEKEPHNRRLLRSIADLHLQRKEFDEALKFYERICSIEGGGADPSVERAIADTHVKKIEHEISLLDPNAPEYAEKQETLRKQRDEFRIAEAKRRVEKYPNDLQFRYDLGKLYFEAGRIGEAIQEFQKSQVNPHKRIASLYYLGLSFGRRNMNDLAVKTLQTAITEKVGFDEEKKELIYALGNVLEKMGKTAEAITEYKHIYEVDIGYKDVAQKVDAYYANTGG